MYAIAGGSGRADARLHASPVGHDGPLVALAHVARQLVAEGRHAPGADHSQVMPLSAQPPPT